MLMNNPYSKIGKLGEAYCVLRISSISSCTALSLLCMDQFQEMNVDFKRSFPYQISVRGYIYAINSFFYLITNYTQYVSLF